MDDELALTFDRVSHDTRIEPDGRSIRKVLRAEFRIGKHKFYEEVTDAPDALEQITTRAEQLRNQLRALPR